MKTKTISNRIKIWCLCIAIGAVYTGCGALNMSINDAARQAVQNQQAPVPDKGGTHANQ